VEVAQQWLAHSSRGNWAWIRMQLVILMGLQGAGKTSFYRRYLAATHQHVSKDLLGNARNRQARQLELIAEALRNGTSVAVDNTNPRISDRAPLIALGGQFGAHIVGVVFESELGECLRRNAERQGRARVPEVAIYSTARQFQFPTTREGFDALFRVRLRAEGFEVNPELPPVEAGGLWFE